MKSLKVHNIRSLVDVEKIELAPITVFVGKNSSGKSTMLRCFPLLKQTFEVRTSEPILWYGNYVDFGSFEESLYLNTSDETIKFEFEFESTAERILSEARRGGFYYDFYGRNSEHREEKLRLVIAVEIKKSQIVKADLVFFDQKIEIEYGEKNKIQKLFVNGSDYLKDTISYRQFISFLPEIAISEEKNMKEEYIYSDSIIRYRNRDNIYLKEIIDTLRRESHNKISDETISNIVRRILAIVSKSHFKEILTSISEPKSISKFFEKTINDDIEFNKLNDMVVLSNLNEIIDIFNVILKNSTSNIFYAKPLRADVQRYYRIQGLNINEISPSGENIPMFINNLGKKEKVEFTKFTQQWFGFNYDITQSTGHVSVQIKANENDKGINISDVGVGYSQVLPIIANLWLLSKRGARGYSISDKIFVIEQPELHLHPAFQAKLIDAFVAIAKKHRLKLVIETHSETMLSRLGNLIAKKQLDSSDVNVYIFDKGNESKTTINKTEYNEKGKLQNWPVGFFSPDM